MSPEGSCLFIFKFYLQNCYVLSIVFLRQTVVFFTARDAEGGAHCVSVMRIYDALSAIKTVSADRRAIALIYTSC